MNQKERLVAELDELFQPRSIAIVGLPQGMKTGKLFPAEIVDSFWFKEDDESISS